MDPTVPAVDALLTVGGLGIITTAVTEIILRAWQPPSDTRTRWGPLMAVVVALVFSVGAAIVLHADLLTAVMTAIVVGWSSMGVYDSVKGMFT